MGCTGGRGAVVSVCMLGGVACTLDVHVALEQACAGLGVAPRESHRFDFFLGLVLARAAKDGNRGCFDAIMKIEDLAPSVVSTLDASGLPALAYAASRGDKNMLQRLLPHADVRCADWRCCSPLSLASAKGHVASATTLLHAGAEANAE